MPKVQIAWRSARPAWCGIDAHEPSRSDASKAAYRALTGVPATIGREAEKAGVWKWWSDADPDSTDHRLCEHCVPYRTVERVDRGIRPGRSCRSPLWGKARRMANESTSGNSHLPRTYRLKPGSLDEFHVVMQQHAVPRRRASGMDVVCYGRSDHEHEGYCLIRAYASRQFLEAQQAAFYNSEEWREGSRRALVAHIETYLNTLLWVSDDAVDSLRELNPSQENIQLQLSEL